MRNEHSELPIDLSDVQAAAERLAPWIHRTPVLTSRSLDARAGNTLFLKCENFQRVGAFKFRGAMNALLQLTDDERRRGVVTHSSGNHGQALALAGQLLGVPVQIVMPRNAPAVKRAATEGYGATVVPCEPTLASRESTVSALIDQEGLVLIHPFEDPRVMAGQGTAALELLEQAGSLDIVIAPCGGGGLLSGVSVAVRSLSPATRVLGAEPERADDARRSLAAGTIVPIGDPNTIADGLKATIGPNTFSVLRTNVDAILTVTEAEIIAAMQYVWERLKIVIEPSSAVAVASVLSKQFDARERRIGVIITGGNVDVAPIFDGLRAKSRAS